MDVLDQMGSGLSPEQTYHKLDKIRLEVSKIVATSELSVSEIYDYLDKGIRK